MNGQPWWQHAVHWTLWGIAMTLIMGWLARSRHKEPERVAGATLIRNPIGVLVLGVACSTMFAGAAVVVVLFVHDNSRFFLGAFFLGFALLGAPVIADYYFDRFEIRDDGIEFRTTFGGSGVAMWAEIAEVTYSRSAKWFRIKLRNGRVVRVSALMIGLPALAESLLARATNARYGDADRKLLLETAAGNPPSVWQ